ncbi:unnamed protein product [Calypogeia fissa]
MDKSYAGLVLLLVVLSLSGKTRGGAPPKPSAFFAFGDSYADTGNQNHNSSCWKYPYGFTWPGHPSGRYGNGHIQTDFLADKLGLPSPPPYVDILNQSIATGVNFAIGGSGVTYALGVLPLNTQVDLFDLVLRTGAYSPSFLADSLTLVSNEGNDYSVKYTDPELFVVVQEVIQGMAVALKRLYDLGLRNILVANLPPINCLPGTTIKFNYTTCELSTYPLILSHNNLLAEAIQKLNTLPGANFLIIDEMASFTYVLNNTEQYGIKETLVSCCKPLTAADNCGDIDAQGNLRYTLCNDPTSYVFWDTEHPVESTWKHVVDLYYNQTGFVIGAATLESWLYQNGLRSLAPTPVAGPVISQGAGAPSEMEGAYQALISELDYAESLGLVQVVNWDEYLVNSPNQAVTIFLPNNIAWYSTPRSTIDQIYGQDLMVPVAQFHVAQGYYDSQMLGSTQNLTTIAGMNLLVTPMSNVTMVGPTNAMVVNPDLYKVQGQLVIHGIDKVLIPPDLPIT